MPINSANLAHIRFTLEAVIDAKGEDHEYLGQRMNSSFGQAIASARANITSNTAATVESISAKTTLLTPEAAALDEDEVYKWIAGQIEDGNMEVERLPLLMARYALADPAETRNELAERMGLSEGDGHPLNNPLATTDANSTEQLETEPKQPDPKDSLLELSPYEEDAWIAYGSDGRQINMSLEEQHAVLATTDAALSGLRQRVRERMEISYVERDAFILAMRMASEGELEIDDDAGVALGADNGAYVCMWKWIEFPEKPDESEPQKQSREGCR